MQTMTSSESITPTLRPVGIFPRHSGTRAFSLSLPRTTASEAIARHRLRHGTAALTKSWNAGGTTKTIGEGLDPRENLTRMRDQMGESGRLARTTGGRTG